MPSVRLESSHPHASNWQRPVAPATRTLRCESDGIAQLTDPAGHLLERFADPLAAIAWLDAHRSAAARWIGYFSYDLGAWLEPAMPRSASPLPLLLFTEHPFADAAEPLPPAPRGTAEYLGSDFPRDLYLKTVTRAIEYIAAGDIFQVNLAQQLRARTDLSPTELFARIQAMFPAWYAALLDYGDFALVCNSPELFLRTWRDSQGTHIETRPIKGTRPRIEGMDRILLESVKDQAELNMIVDLERNDLGRICQIGSVRVTQPRSIETHPTVFHGSATVAGTLRPDISLLDILKATFPGGSITGAPKIRATQIIRDLERTPRGPYCGAIGYLDADVLEFNIAIRTMVYHEGIVRIPVGGGIVADSDPQHEYDETFTKARAALVALGLG